MPRLTAHSAILLGLLAFSCADSTPPPADRIAAVESLRAAIDQGDIDAAKKFLTDDRRLWYEERTGEGEPWKIDGGTWKGWDEHFHGRSERVSEWVVADGAVSAEMQENNDYYRLTESSGGRWRATYFFDDKNRIAGFMVSAVPGAASDRGRRDEFEAWAKAKHAEEIEYLMPGGSIDPTGDRPVRMRNLLNAWRDEVGLAPTPAR